MAHGKHVVHFETKTGRGSVTVGETETLVCKSKRRYLKEKAKVEALGTL